MSNFKILSFLLWVSFITACETIAFEEYRDESPKAVFEEAWAFADQYYSYF